MQLNLGWIDLSYESANTIKCKNWLVAGFLFYIATPIGVRLFQEGAEQDGAEQGAVLDWDSLSRLVTDYPPIGATAPACTLWKNIDKLWIL